MTSACPSTSSRKFGRRYLVTRRVTLASPSHPAFLKMPRMLLNPVLHSRYLIQKNVKDSDNVLSCSINQATDLNSNSSVVLKTGLDIVAHEAHVLERLNRENSPNIIKMLQYYDEQSQKALVLEYCSGGDLYDFIQSPEYDLNVAKRIFRQVSTGLSVVHATNISHRGISLESILLNEDHTVAKISDFGLACCTNEVCSLTLGRKFYIAPEALLGEHYDPKAADIWSLGILLYIMLTKTPAFEVASESDSRFSFMSRFGVKALLTTSGIGGIPDDALDLLESMICVNPSDRIEITKVLNHSYCN